MRYLIFLIINILSSCYIGEKYNNIPYPNQRYLDYNINLEQEDIKSMNGLYKYRNNYQLNEIEAEEQQNYSPGNNITQPQQYPDQFIESPIINEENLREYPIYENNEEVENPQDYIDNNIDYSLEPIDNYYMNQNYLNQSILPYNSNNSNNYVPPKYNKQYPYNAKKAESFKKYNNMQQYLKEKRFLKQDITSNLEKFPEINQNKSNSNLKQKSKKNKYNLMDRDYFSPKYQKIINEKDKYKYPAKPTIIKNKFIDDLDNDLTKDLSTNNPENKFFSNR